jgi:predicted DNA helicase
LDLALDRGLPALRVGHPARVSPQLQEHTLDLRVEEHPDRVLARELFDEAYDLLGYARRQRTQGRSRDRFANARASQSEARRLMDEARALERKAVDAILGQARVVAATLSGLPAFPLRDERFDLVLIDEATQAIEPLTLLGWLRAERVVLAGDPLQLPPTVLSRAAAGLQLSLFERLLQEHGDEVKALLREQYRMNAEIMEYPNLATYAGQLRAHPSVAQRTLSDRLTDASLDAPPVLFLDTAGKGFDDATEAEGGSHFNEGEAQLVQARAHALLKAGLPPHELALIAPYRAQVARLRPGFEDSEVEVDTVDAFQGREKDAVLISLTRSNPDGELGFLNDLRRINVALTRARRHLFIVGDSATLSRHPYYSGLIESIQARGGYRSAWEWTEAGN